MFCQHCGSSMAAEINYCKNCGARNERHSLIVRNSSSGIMGVGAVFIGIVGIIAFYPIMRELLINHVDPTALVLLMATYVVAVLGMFAVLVGHTWKNSGDIRIKSAEHGDSYLPPAPFSRTNTARLTEARERPASVTEHTTRALDEVPVRRS